MEHTRIILVDDEAESLQVMKRALQLDGYEVTAFERAEAALNYIFTEPAGQMTNYLLVTDIQMPGMNGDELIACLQAAGLPVPVLAITAYGDKELILRLMRHGCHDFLDKPVSIQTLSRTIRAISDRLSRERSWQQGRTGPGGSSRIAGQVIHNVNNLLLGLSTLADLIEHDRPGDQAAQEHLAIIHHLTGEASQIMNHFLTGTADAGRELQLVDLARLTRDVTPFLQLRGGFKPAMEVVLPYEPAWILAPPSRAIRLLMSLTRNNGGSSSRNGHFRISVFPVPDRVPAPADEKKLFPVCLEVQHTWNRLPHPETRGDLSAPGCWPEGDLQDPDPSGIVDLVQGLGASLESEHDPDRGSTFRITFPGLPRYLWPGTKANDLQQPEFPPGVRERE